MSSNSMIKQLLNDAKNTVDQVILNTDHIDHFANKLTEAKVPALIINNRLPVGKSVDMKKINSLREKGVEYYPAGRTGMPSLVAAEDGLAVPGAVLATTDRNLLELAVLGAYVLLLDETDMLSLLGTGRLDIPEPDVTNIVLQGKTGEWSGGFDIALHMLKYYDIPKDTLLEIQGEGLTALSLNERFNLARTLVDLGYERLLFQVDEAVLAFLQDRSQGEGRFYFPDADAPKETVIHVDLGKVHPMIAWKEKDAIQLAPLIDKDGAEIDLLFIGGDNAGRYADIQDGLKLIRYRPLADTVTGSIIPGSQLVYGDLLDMGIAGILTEIGFDLLPSSIMDLISERADASQHRLGTSLQILHSGGMAANALSCFSAAMTGKITHPLELESILKQEEEHHHDHE